MMKRRFFLTGATTLCALTLLPGSAAAQSTHPIGVMTLAAAWRQGAEASANFVGRLQADWAAGLVHVKSAVPVPTRAHGLLAEPGGGFVAVASRPGQWLLRCDANGEPMQWHRMEGETGGRTLDGHICASPNGEWLYTAETNPLSGQGWVGVRESRSLRKVAEWRTHGVEPHQLVLDSSGALMVANGGILRTEGDKKRDLHLMDSSLVRLNPATGERLGQWRLKDARLSLRHLAWSHPGAGGDTSGQAKPLLGIALQAEHDDLTQRRAAPVFAVLDGDSLEMPTLVAAGAGYAGDIAAGPDGGFVLSCQRAGLAVQWRPAAPTDLVTVAQLQEVCALAPWRAELQESGLLIGAARGVGRWHPVVEPGFLKWPDALALDNHWVVI